jgi:NAD kinase
MSADKKIALRLDDLPSNEALVTIDGCQQAHIKSTDEVVVTKSGYVTSLIRMGRRSFYDTLIKKLS